MTRRWLILIVAIHTSAWAEPSAPAMPTLGHVLTTPAQRQALERQAQGLPTDGPGRATPIEGVMQRSDGATVIWQDGRAQFWPPTAPPTGARP